MKTNIKIKFIYWTKVTLAIFGFLIWIATILNIASSPTPFIEQAPYCMISTMIIFAILSAIYRGLDYIIDRNTPKKDD